MALVRVASLAELKRHSLLEFRDGARAIALCSSDGAIHALEGTCPHLGGPLAQGNLAGGRLICPWHAWEFQCATGEAGHNGQVKLQRFAVEIRGDDVFADLP